MRIEAHNGPQPLRKTAGDDPILVWVPTTQLPVNTGRPAHMTMFRVVAQPQQVNDYFAQQKVKIYQHTSAAFSEIVETPNASTLLWLNFSQDPWFNNMSALFQRFIGKAGIQTNVDTGGESQATPHVGIQYGTGTQLEIPQRKLGQNVSVSFEGPFVMDGNKIWPRQGMRTSASTIMDATIDMIHGGW